MKRILLIFFCMLFAPGGMGANFKKSADHLINRIDPAINIGIAVVDLKSGETIYRRNDSRVFIPASNMKLFSDAAALMALGPDYRFATKLGTNAKYLDKGELKGSVFLYLPGDPSFNQTHLDNLLKQLKKWKISRIKGNVVLVSQNRYITPQAPGWVVEDLKHSYGAPIAPVILDENRLTITVNPAYQAGKPALIEASEKTNNWHINNQVRTKRSGKHCGIDINMDRNNHLTVRGCVGVGQWAVQQRIAIQNPLRYAQDIIRQKLIDHAIHLDGQVVLGNAPPNTLHLGTHYSKPISQLMADTLKPSDNLYADSLFLHTAAKLKGKPQNWKAAQTTVKRFIQKQTGINLHRAVLTDGSGLSRYDQLTPNQTVALLRFLHERFPLAYEYIAALPVAGHDGTLLRRFRKPGQKGLIRAKTGTMSGVISLSGYLYTANAHTLAFAIFINNTPGTSPKVSGQYRYLVDALCEYFLNQQPKHRLLNLVKNAHAQVAYQKNLPQAAVKRRKGAQWRQLESTLKNALRHQEVAFIYRRDEIVLNDYTSDANNVWKILQSAQKKHSFSVALESGHPLATQNRSPFLLWIKTLPQAPQPKRIWKVRKTIS